MSSLTRCTTIVNFVIFFYIALVQNSFTTAMTPETNKPDHLSIYFVTWNVANKQPEQDVHSLLNLIKIKESEKKLPDMYILGLQEVRTQPQDLLMNIFTFDLWTQCFREALKKYDYVKIKTAKLQGIVINAFVLRKHVPHLRFIENSFTKTGLGGFWGNKGASSIRMNLYGVSVCFVNSHLPAHDTGLKERIADYKTIIDLHVYNNLETKHILYHDYVFWIGDLNFRLDEGLLNEDIVLLVKNNTFESLLQKDQLIIAKNNQEAFSGFNEEKITFAPTYKYEFGSQNFDLKRRPSWTDRILYKVNRDSYKDIMLKALQHNYKSHPFYVQSDHKPVTGEFDINVRQDYINEGVNLTVPEWYLNEENTVIYEVFGGYMPCETDYIGLYYDNFDSIDDYIAYEYIKVNHVEGEQNNVNRLYFSFAAARSTTESYRLIYFSEKQSALSILGISCAFSINERSNLSVQNCY